MLKEGIVTEVPANMLKANPNHIRNMRDGWKDDPELKGMAETIVNKQYRPLQVYPNYIIHDGHRRWQSAMKHITRGHKLLCHVIPNPNDKTKDLIGQIITDHHTKTLSMSQKACAIRELKKEGLKGGEIATIIKLTESYVSQLSKFSEHPDLMDALDRQEMTWDEIYEKLYTSKHRSDMAKDNTPPDPPEPPNEPDDDPDPPNDPIDPPIDPPPIPPAPIQPQVPPGEPPLEPPTKPPEKKEPKDKELEKALKKRTKGTQSNTQYKKLVEKVDADIGKLERDALSIIEDLRTLEKSDPKLNPVVMTDKILKRIGASIRILKEIDRNLRKNIPTPLIN